MPACAGLAALLLAAGPALAGATGTSAAPTSATAVPAPPSVSAPGAGSTTGTAAGAVALVLAVDTSGSMAQSDPAGGRAAAVRAAAAALQPGDWMGLVTFAAAPDVLVPLQAMDGPGARAAVDAAAGQIGASGYTDLLGALQTGAQVLGADANPSDQHVLVLLTDGVPDLPSLAAPSAMAAYLQEMDGEAQAIGARGWVLDTIGLGSAVDASELQGLAGLGHGRYVAAPVSASLPQDVVGLLPSGEGVGTSPAAASSATGGAGAPTPAAAPQPVPLSLTPLPLPGPAITGATLLLRVRAVNGGPLPQRLGLSASGATLGGRGAAHTLLVPPGTTLLTIPVRPVGVPVGAPSDVELRVSAPTGVQLTSGALRWRVLLRPWWRVWPRAHAAGLAAAAAAVGAALLLLGYGGYGLRIAPRLTPRGRLEVVGPNGDHLGMIRIPRRRSVTFGAADAPRGTVRLPWVPGEDRFFDLRAEVPALRGGPWRAGVGAWFHPPVGIVYAEAVWPYHLYPGPMPCQRVDLYPDTVFGAAGLTFTFRSGGPAAEAGTVGVNVLAGMPGADDGEEGGGLAAPPVPPFRDGTV